MISCWGGPLKQFGEGIAGDLDSIFLPHLLADSGGPPRVSGVVEQVMQLGGNARWGAAVARNRPGDAKANRALGIVCLVPGTGHDQHWTP